jgi:hypothetical protein
VSIAGAFASHRIAPGWVAGALAAPCAVLCIVAAIVQIVYCLIRFVSSDSLFQICLCKFVRLFVQICLFIFFSSDSILKIRLLNRCQDSSQRLDASFGQAVALELQSQCLRMVRTHLLKCLVFVCFLLRVSWVVMHSFAQNSFSYLFVQICSLIVAQVSSLFARFSLHLFAQTHIILFTNRC